MDEGVEQATDSTPWMLVLQQIVAIAHTTRRTQAGASDTAACCATCHCARYCVQATVLRRNTIVHVHFRFRFHIEAATANLKWTASSYLCQVPDMALAGTPECWYPNRKARRGSGQERKVCMLVIDVVDIRPTAASSQVLAQGTPALIIAAAAAVAAIEAVEDVLFAAVALVWALVWSVAAAVATDVVAVAPCAVAAAASVVVACPVASAAVAVQEVAASLEVVSSAFVSATVVMMAHEGETAVLAQKSPNCVP